MNKTRIELQKSKETSERLAKETQDREEKLQRDQKNLEKLEKSIAQSKKNITDKNIKLIALKKTRKDENNLRESASRRMHLLSFEYFDAAKKIEQDESKRVKVSQFINVTSRQIWKLSYVRDRV